MTKDRAISVDEARALALLGWHRDAEGWTKGKNHEGSTLWQIDLRYAEASVCAAKQISYAIEGSLNGIGSLGDGRHDVQLESVQRLSDSEFLVFASVGVAHDCIFRIQVQGWKP